MTITKFNRLEPQRCEVIKGIVAPEIGTKKFGTSEEQAAEPKITPINQIYVSCGEYKQNYILVFVNAMVMAPAYFLL